MRIARLLIPILLTSACGDDPTVLDGFLAEGSEATHVWVLGEPERSAIEADSFRIEGVEGEVLDLRFAEGEREVARMEVRGVAAGDQVRLRDIWFDDGIAYPSAVEREGSAVVTVNGLRMGGAGAVPSAVDVQATVLAASREGDALIVRPAGPEMPDLRVVVTPGTNVHTPDGDPADADELEFGDSLRVVGQGEAGFVIATELVLPRSRAGRASADTDAAERTLVRPVSAPVPPVRAARPSAGAGRGSDDRGRGWEKEMEKAAAEAREREKERRKEAEKAREKGREKGKGKG